MKAQDFKFLKEKIEHNIKDVHNTFMLRNAHYVFHDDEMSEFDSSKKGISFIFSSDELRIEQFLLLDLITENGRTRYTNSKNISSGFYLLSQKQKSTLIQLLDEKSGAVIV